MAQSLQELAYMYTYMYVGVYPPHQDSSINTCIYMYNIIKVWE